MEVIILLENSAEHNSPLLSKHGLSLYIDTGKEKLLFDTGPDDSFVHNAKELGVDLRQVDMLVISHAHHDHGGGLKTFLEINRKARVFISPYVLGEYYAQRGENEFQYIGLDQTVLKDGRDRITFIQQKTEIASGITLLKTTEHSTFQPSAVLLRKQNGILEKDTFEHELIMVIEDQVKVQGEDQGQVVLHVFTGCSHNGIINMVLSVEKEFPGKKIQTLVGGFHLMNTKTNKLAEEEQTVKDLAIVLREHNIERIYTGHCTGTEALEVLQGVLGNRIDGISTGKDIRI